MYNNSTEKIIKAQKGNQEIMTELIENNKALIWSIVRRFKDRGCELEDLYQIGCVGFIKSIKRFDTNFEVQLSTYAVPYILGEIKRFIRDDGLIKVSRSIKELNVKIKELQKENMIKKGEEITIEELSAILKISKEDISLAIDSSNNVESIYAEKSNEEEVNILDKLKCGEDEEKNVINKIIVEDLLKDLNEREKKIIIFRFYRGSTQGEVAKMLGITQVQVSRLEKKILNSMKVKLVG